MPASLNLGQDYKTVDDRVSVTITNPDATSVTTSDAFGEQSVENDIDQGGFSIKLVQKRWHVWAARLSTTTFVPVRDGRVIHGTNSWYIDAVSLMTNGTRFEIDTTLQSEKGLR